MKTMHIGTALLATAAIACGGLNLTAKTAQSAPAAPTRQATKSILLTVEGMH